MSTINRTCIIRTFTNTGAAREIILHIDMLIYNNMYSYMQYMEYKKRAKPSVS